MKRLVMWAGALLLSVLPMGVLGQSTQTTTTVEYRWPDSLKGKQDNVKALLVKDGRIFAGTDSKYLWISADTGKTWVQRGPESGLNIPFGTVFALVATRSGKLLLGAEEWIYASTDNGNTWNRAFNRSASCFLIARSGTVFAGRTGIWRSADDGVTWMQAVDTSVADNVWRMVETTSGTVLAGNCDAWSWSAKGIARSTDGGNTWVLSNTGLTNKNIFGLAAYPSGFSRDVYAVTYDGGAFKSEDDGLSWRPITEIPERLGGAAGAFSPLGVFLGFTWPKTEPLYQSYGAGWRVLPGLKGYMVLSLAQFSASQLLVGTHDGMFLVSFYNPTFVVEGQGTPETFQLSQNYPNPFNPTTTIEFSLPKSSFVALKVMNLIGQEVATLVASELSAGTHRVEWDAGKYPSGIYFYRLQTNDFVQTRKMVLLK